MPLISILQVTIILSLGAPGCAPPAAVAPRSVPSRRPESSFKFVRDLLCCIQSAAERRTRHCAGSNNGAQNRTHNLHNLMENQCKIVAKKCSNINEESIENQSKIRQKSFKNHPWGCQSRSGWGPSWGALEHPPHLQLVARSRSLFAAGDSQTTPVLSDLIPVNLYHVIFLNSFCVLMLMYETSGLALRSNRTMVAVVVVAVASNNQ